MQIKEKLLSLLACPVCKDELKQEADKLVCLGCVREFPLKEVAGLNGTGMLMPDFLEHGEK